MKHWMIATSGGHYDAMDVMRKIFEKGAVSRESVSSTLTAYNNSCAEKRSEARDNYILTKVRPDQGEPGAGS